MLNLLTSQNLSNILMIVTRYFGGILLGTGGLVKAYTATSMEALKQVNIVQKECGKEVKVCGSYADLEKLKYDCKQKNIAIVDIFYEEAVNVIIEMSQEKLEEMLEQKENLNFKLLKYEILRDKFITVT